MRWRGSLQTSTPLSIAVRTKFRWTLGPRRYRGSKMSSNSMCKLGPSARASSCLSVEPTREDSVVSSAFQAAEAGVEAAVEVSRQARWFAENRNALDGSNTFVEQVGLP